MNILPLQILLVLCYHNAEMVLASNDMPPGDSAASVVDEGFQISWRRIVGPKIKFVSAGPAGVWGIKKNSRVVYLNQTRNTVQPPENQNWIYIGSKMKMISVGDVVVTTNSKDKAFIREGVTAAKPTGSSWEKYSQKLARLAASGYNNEVWGAYKKRLYSLTPVTPSNLNLQGSWVQDSNEDRKFLSLGQYGMWALSSSFDIFFRKYSSNSWVSVDNLPSMKASRVEAGSNWVVATQDGTGHIYVRQGVNAQTPDGTAWLQLQFDHGSVRQAALYQDQLYAVNMDHEVWTGKLSWD